MPLAATAKPSADSELTEEGRSWRDNSPLGFEGRSGHIPLLVTLRLHGLIRITHGLERHAGAALGTGEGFPGGSDLGRPAFAAAGATCVDSSDHLVPPGSGSFPV